MRMQTPPHASQGRCDKGMGRWHGMPREFDVTAAQASHPACLQIVFRVEDQTGRLSEAPRSDTAAEVTRHVFRARSRDVAHGPQWPTVEARRGPRCSGDGRQHRAAAQPRGGVILVIHQQLNKHGSIGSVGGDSWCEPGGQAVCIDGDWQRDAGEPLWGQRRQRTLQFLFEKPHAVDVLAQAPTRVGVSSFSVQ